MCKRIAVAAAVIGILCAPTATASAQPTSPLCDDGSWRKAHPLICDTGQSGPFTIGSGGGGGSSGRGLIGSLLGGLTGGLL